MILEASFRVELNDRETGEYLQALKDVPLMDLSEAVQDCKRSWRPHFGVSFPPIFDLLDFVNVAHGRRLLDRTSREIINRDEKPPDWEAMGRRAGVTKGQIAEWLEVGKQAARDRYARLAEDPSWQDMNRKFGMPGLKPVEKQVPIDREERASWARTTAKESGWTK